MIGQTLSHYRVLDKLGEGGMGEVYLAEDTRLRRKVALKLLPERFAADPRRRQRFQREAIAASALNHPNIGVVYEPGETQDGRPFISMEYIAGETLAALLGRRKLRIDEIVDIAIAIAEALDEARHHGIVHRDIKPGNVMLDSHGRVKVLDFGIAKVRDPDSRDGTASSTATLDEDIGVLIGTADYMSPEQAHGGTVDHRSDLFSLGVVLYEMVSGRHPFSGTSAEGILTRITQLQPQRLVRSRPDCPAELDRIIFKCLEKDVDGRYQTARELLLDLHNVRTSIAAGARRRWLSPTLWMSAASAVATIAVLTLWMSEANPKAKSSAPAAPAPKSIAVLPFVNMSGDPANEYLADGTTEEIINALAQIHDLKVVSRTSAFAWKGKHADVREVGNSLGVDSVVEGSIRKSGETLRVTAQLVDVKDGYHLWSGTKERPLADVFAIQDEIATAVAGALQANLAPGRKLMRRPTQDLAAYELYVSARHFADRWTSGSFEKAIRLYRQAIDRDPALAAAWAGLADTYSLMDHATGQSRLGPEEANALAIHSATKALELDRDSVEAWTALGHILTHQGKFAEAEDHLRRALALNPNSASAHLWYGVLLLVTGRSGFQHVDKARELDPLSPYVSLVAATVAYNGGDLNKSIEIAQRGLEMEPDYGRMHVLLADAYTAAERYSEAMEIIDEAAELAQRPPELDEQRAVLLAMAERPAEARSLLNKIISEKENPSSRRISFAYAALGETDRAMDWFQRYVRETPYFARITVHFPPHPKFDRVRVDPRYVAVRKQLGRAILHPTAPGARAGVDGMVRSLPRSLPRRRRRAAAPATNRGMHL